MIKLVFGSKNKIIKHEKRSFQLLKESIKLNFPDAPFDYSLSYLDEDKDEICLNSDEDLNNMFNSKAKIHKVYIKQSLSQTIVIDVQRTDFIEPSFDNISVIQQDKRESLGDKHFVNDFLRQSKAVKVKLNPVQKIQVQRLPQTQQESIEPIQEKTSKQKVANQTNKEVMITVIKQEAKIQEIIVQKPIIIKPITLQISPEKRVHSKVSHFYNKQSSKEQEMMKIVHKTKIFHKYAEPKNISKCQEVLQVHGVICSNCKDQFGILGVRYQCILCNYFNLCSQCEIFTQHPHALLKVKKPQQFMSDTILIEKFKRQFSIPQQEKVIPSGHFVPSIDKQNAFRLLQTAKQSYEQGLLRTKNLLQQLFFKMEMSHKNPYQVMKPIKQLKIQTAAEKAQHLSDLVGISYNQAMRFVSQYPPATNKQLIVAKFLEMKK